MSNESAFRAPTADEQALLHRLLRADFPGRDELAGMIDEVEVKTIDEIGSLELRSRSPIMAPVIKRVPVEAEAADEDGYFIHVLLHVINGRPSELEIFKDDGSTVRRMPPPSDFELIVLPPAPTPGH